MSKRTDKKTRERFENEIRLKAKVMRLTPQHEKDLKTFNHPAKHSALPSLDVLKWVEDGNFTGATMITFKPPRQQTVFFRDQ